MTEAGADRRRSRRVPLRVPVVIASDGMREASWTLSVSANGALVTCSRPFEAGQKVVVVNVATGRSTDAEVVTPFLPEAGGGAVHAPGGGFRLAIRLVVPDEAFWGPAYSKTVRDGES